MRQVCLTVGRDVMSCQVKAIFCISRVASNGGSINAADDDVGQSHLRSPRFSRVTGFLSLFVSKIVISALPRLIAN